MNDSNIERTGDRDLRWSEIMRMPSSDSSSACHYLRSLDLDAFVLCDRCALPIFLVEATRDEKYRFKVYDKAHTYVKHIAKKIGCPYLVCWHGIEEDGVERIRVYDGKNINTFTTPNWKKGIELLFKTHAFKCRGRSS